MTQHQQAIGDTSVHSDAIYAGAGWGVPTAPSAATDRPTHTGLLMTVEQVAELWFGEVGEGGSASSNCQKIRRLIPDTLPARRIGNRWYVNRVTAESWAAGNDPASVMAHPDSGRFA